MRHGVDEAVHGQLGDDLAVSRGRDPPYERRRLSVLAPLVQQHDPLTCSTIQSHEIMADLQTFISKFSFRTEIGRPCNANRGLMSAMVSEASRLFSALICRMSLSSYLGSM